MSAPTLRFEVPEQASGERLDTFVAEHAGPHSRSAWKRFIEEGRVTVDGRPVTKAGFALRAGMRIAASPAEGGPPTLEGEAIPIDVVFEDAHLAVVLKPAGLVVHPGHGARRGTLVHALLGRGMPLAPLGGPERPGIVHRLDKETSGLLVVAKTDAAHRALAAMFAERRIKKTYLALLWGRPRPASGRIDAPIGRNRRDRTKMAEGAPGGRPATTVYRTVEALHGFTLVEIDLITGRTHQIRVHFAARRHPVLGDARYGGSPWKAMRDPRRRAVIGRLGRLALHAARLELPHPVTGAPLDLRCPLPDALLGLLASLREDA